MIRKNPHTGAVTHLATLGLAGSLALAAVGTISACSPKGPGGQSPQSPERQSETEYDLARDLYERGKPREALDHVRRAIELHEENDKALYFAAAIHLSFCAGDRGMADPDCRIGDAEKYAKAAVKANDSFRDAKNLLGQIYILEKRYHEAILVLEPLTRDVAYTDSYLAWGNLGWAQVLDGSVDAGITSLKNSVTQPRFCVGFYRLGFAYERKNELSAAEKSYSDALGVESPDCQALQDAWEARGRARAKLGRPDDAKKDFERCRELSKETATGKACQSALSSLSSGGSGGGGKP
jgi:tetratricopeptide (TPR) repeat protein